MTRIENRCHTKSEENHFSRKIFAKKVKNCNYGLNLSQMVLSDFIMNVKIRRALFSNKSILINKECFLQRMQCYAIFCSKKEQIVAEMSFFLPNQGFYAFLVIEFLFHLENIFFKSIIWEVFCRHLEFSRLIHASEFSSQIVCSKVIPLCLNVRKISKLFFGLLITQNCFFVFFAKLCGICLRIWKSF